MTKTLIVTITIIFHLYLTSFIHCIKYPCEGNALRQTRTCDVSLTVTDRVRDLISRMTLAEKISQMGNKADPIPRLDIDGYEWWNECLHGVGMSPGVNFTGEAPYATMFPQVIGIAQSFNMTLVTSMAQVISTEARAFSNLGQAGFTFFAPNINIFRDPRWGRGQETPGEDPYLSSEYAYHYSTGMQEGEDPRYLKNVINCKHYAAYSLEAWHGVDRHHFNAIVNNQDLVDTYLPAFEACVGRGKAGSVMCSYNELNGVPSCANPFLLQTLLRDSFGFDGFVVSDCNAIDDIYRTHKYVNTTEETCSIAIKAGCDLDCGGFFKKYLKKAVELSIISEHEIDRALFRLYKILFRVGLFDPVTTQPYLNISPQAINTKEHQQLALQSARESIVLLKNEQNILPLKRAQVKSVAVIGPNANDKIVLKGNYFGVPPFVITPVEGFEQKGLPVIYARGCINVTSNEETEFDEAVSAAQKADVVVLVLGLDQTVEREGLDRESISLPGAQWNLFQRIRREIKYSKPIITVFIAGGPIDISIAKDNAAAILWAGYPGQSGGQAIADIIFGDYNPSGRLAYTLYPEDYVNQVSMFDMDMRPSSKSPGRTYRFYAGPVVYPFGYGLSYTSFNVTWSKSQAKLQAQNKLLDLSNLQFIQKDTKIASFEAIVSNTGKRDGEVSVLAYIQSERDDFPLRQLFGFKKVFLRAGEQAKVFFPLLARSIATVEKSGAMSIQSGKYFIHLGDDTMVRMGMEIKDRVSVLQ